MSDGDNPLSDRGDNSAFARCDARGCTMQVPRSKEIQLRARPADAGRGGSMMSIYLCEGCRIAVFNRVYEEHRS